VNIRYIKGKETTLVFTDAELAFAFMALSAYVQNSGGRLTGEVARLHAILDDMTMEIKRRVEHQKIALRFKLCCKCFKEIDTDTDKYFHNLFESGDELYQHQECPPTNTGKGYEQ